MRFAWTESAAPLVRCAARITTARTWKQAQHGTGKPVWRPGACQLRPGRGAWFCITARRSWKAPHGALCAALLPHGMAANVAALRARAPLHPALERYATIAQLLTGRNQVSAEDGIDWVHALCAEFHIPTAALLGHRAKADLPGVVENAARASSMQANPLPLTSEELLAVVTSAW